MNQLTTYAVGGRYQVTQPIGEPGSFAQTYLGKDLQGFGRVCAIKHFTFERQNRQQFQKAKELFQREAMVLQQLTGTDSPITTEIPRFLAYIEEHEDIFLVEEYIDGKTLREELDSQGRFSEEEVSALLEDVLETLAIIHDQNFIHRDIKPPNLIRRDSNKQFVLIDFGAVKAQVTQVVSPNTKIYTEGYAPPEQTSGRYLSPNTDIYCLGITALEALTGLQPKDFIDPNTSGVAWNHLKQKELNHQLNKSKTLPKLVKILEKMVEPESHKRYRFAKDVLLDLEGYYKTEKLGLTPSPVKPVVKPNLSSGIQIPQWVWLAASVPVTIATFFTISTTAVRFILSPAQPGQEQPKQPNNPVNPRISQPNNPVNPTPSQPHDGGNGTTEIPEPDQPPECGPFVPPEDCTPS